MATTCAITPADLGDQFAAVPVDVAQAVIDMATIIVLGPDTCQAATEAKWRCSCLDPCEAIKLLAQHVLSVDPDIGIGSSTVLSEKVGDVSATYANTSGASGAFGDSIYGRLYAMMQANFNKLNSARRFLPFGVGGSAGC